MPHYRIYFLKPSGEIVGAEEVECADDQDAVTTATTMMDKHPAVETWQQKRVIGKFDRPERSG
jgi:hypothetical protein